MRYTTRCARMCSTQAGYPRPGDQWVHVFGSTEWVCRTCAEYLGRQAGIPTMAQIRRATQRREASMQMALPDDGDPHLTAPRRA